MPSIEPIQGILETRTRKGWFFTLLILLQFVVPPYASKGFDVAQWGDIIHTTLGRGLYYSWKPVFPIFQIIPIALIVKSLQTSPEDQLRAPEQPAPWGEEIEYAVCRRCSTPNEKGSASCCVCGVSLGPTGAAHSGDSIRSIQLFKGILVLTILVILVSMVLLGIF